MKKVELNKPFVFKPDGEMLAKVLLYYGLIPDVQSVIYKIVCPFHNDLNPSMIADLSTGTFFCFGCGLSGDAYKFVSLMYEKENDIQILKRLFKIINSDKVSKLDFSHRTGKSKKESEQLYIEAHDYFYGLSKINWIKDKSDEVLTCKNYMRKRGFKANTLKRCDARITYNMAYPIIFPMLDNGEFKGWVCRTNNPDVEKIRKYLYNKGFSRATTLVGDYKNQEIIFVVEGYMDRLKFIQFGISNVVAILGWKMSKEQERKLKNENVKIIVSALDNDECGKKGTEYLKTIFPNVVRFQYIKGIKDAGEMNEQLFNKMFSKTQKIINEKLAQDKRKR